MTGYSYGGYMTCYLTSRDDRFAAAVAGGVVSDLASMAGTSDAGHFLGEHELGGPPWAARDRYDAMSPLARGRPASATPTLVYHGAADLRCPRRPGAAVAHRAARARRADAARALPRGVPPVRPRRAAVAPARLQPARSSTGSSSTPASDRTASTAIDADHWQRRLAELAERHRVPGAALGILRFGPGARTSVVEAAYGVLNKETGVETTTDSVFQIGSMTKVWTATVVMQLVDEGLLDLDAPIVDVLPELRLADADVTKQVTMRHLLAHTSGIDGDVFTDTGRGDDCLEKYVGAARARPRRTIRSARPGRTATPASRWPAG